MSSNFLNTLYSYAITPSVLRGTILLPMRHKISNLQSKLQWTARGHVCLYHRRKILCFYDLDQVIVVHVHVKFGVLSLALIVTGILTLNYTLLTKPS